MNRKLSLNVVAIVLAVLLLPVFAGAMFMRPQEVPVDRLIQNVQAFIKEHPDDAMAYYTLARIHNLAIALKQETLRVWMREGQLPTAPDMFNGQPAQNPKIDPKEMQTHLIESIKNYNIAIGKDEKNALFHLGRASLLEAALDGGFDLPPIPDFKPAGEVKDWKPVYLNESIRENLRAYDLSFAKDNALERLPIQGLRSLVSFEAGMHYLALAQREGAEAELKKRTDEVDAGVKSLKQKRMGAITPIVFSFSGATRLDELLEPSRTVRFDLDSTGRPQSWPWVKADTAILVWDPKGTGRIESGKQLFGSVTWWIFWKDGYAALDALDDNRDGRLSGDELRGLAVWFDRNGNGVSEPGEVVPIDSVGVQSIEVHSTGREGQSPSHRLGLRLKDGRVLPTWDWVVQPSADRAR